VEILGMDRRVVRLDVEDMGWDGIDWIELTQD
jgi:hypothetical protein